ncbi:Hsp70 family protein [Actinokineospora sp. NBRC 105648]|uniref:Hsp70 family protein n=1 Tax=Actinokineospora sp. NBRC 105648 TaxID=3032206 RepID=UPI0024A42C3D|nr:Hsp70 family protein [Actinokineospora sp. NBRC 105648]GLZ36415.1 molecular chaperone DnaK [Actinokineospora sp. NBRC 105648]
MSYVLGVDVGRSRGAAAVRRRAAGGYGAPEVVPLDGGARWTPAVLFVAGDGEVLVGPAAERLAADQPDRVARAVADRVGDDTAVLLGGELYPAETLFAAVVAWVVDLVAEREGGEPDRLAVTHPPEWGSYRRALLREALRAAGLPGALLIPTVVAAAEARHEREPVRAGSAVVVSLVGGLRVEHAVLRRTPTAFDLVTHHAPDVDAGAVLDDLLADHVLAAAPPPDPDLTLPDVLTALPSTPTTAAMATFRTACTAAKERLSVAAEVRVPVPHLRTDVTVTRAEFAELAHPVLGPTATAIRALLARTPPDTTVVLAGGTARVPLLATLTDCLVDDDPATAPARGAALAAAPPHRARNDFATRGDPRPHPASQSSPGFHPASIHDPRLLGTTGDPRPLGAGSGSGQGFHSVSREGRRSMAAGAGVHQDGDLRSRPAVESGPGFQPASTLEPRQVGTGSDPRPRLASASDPRLPPVLGGRVGDPLLAPPPPPHRGVREPESDPHLAPVEPVLSTVDIDDDPPARPPVAVTPLRPPPKRFARRNRTDEDEDGR